MLSSTKTITILCISLLSCILFSTLATGQDKTGWINEKVTLRFQKEPMSTVLEKIAQQTGIAILYDEKLADQTVTGSYKDVKFSGAINRLFSEKNKSIQVFKNEKKIIVKTFGAKQFILAGKDSTSGSTKRANESEKMTLAELEKMHKQQYKEYKERIADKNEVLEAGITRGQLDAMHKQQYNEYKKNLADKNGIIQGGSTVITRGELDAMHKQQYNEYKERSTDGNEIIKGGSTSITRAELDIMHKQQYNEYKEHSTDGNEIIKGGSTSITRAELDIMHKQQYTNLKEKSSEDSQKVD